MATNRLYKDLDLNSVPEETMDNYSFPEDKRNIARYIEFNNNDRVFEWDENYYHWIGWMGSNYIALKCMLHIMGEGGYSIRLTRNRLQPMWKYCGYRIFPFLHVMATCHYIRTKKYDFRNPYSTGELK